LISSYLKARFIPGFLLPKENDLAFCLAGIDTFSPYLHLFTFLLMAKVAMTFLSDVYPCYFKIQFSASRERVSTKALVEENSYSIVEINNDGDNPLSACPKGAKLENQFGVAIFDKGIAINFILRFDLTS
jgi:hypothetical protein